MTTDTPAAPTWVVMPVLSAPEMTLTAISDVLAQSVPTRLLIINQGVDDAFRRQLERVAEAQSDRVLLWSHQPPLPSLSATWNRALDGVWQSGGTEALVVNNDVRLHRRLVEMLRHYLCDPAGHALVGGPPLFITAVGVTEAQFALANAQDELLYSSSRGGPDFSCFLISQECHEQYRFDDAFSPAFCEDLDYHRRLMLAGLGDRIFSINLPYLHYASQTLKTVTPEARAGIERAISAGSRAHYQRKWGGPVNGERYTIPFDAETDQDWVTTPELQAAGARNG